MIASLRAPKQARSVETYNRILDAAEAVMTEKSFDDATIEEIVSRANLTTGAFYARFRNKEALFRHLEDRMTREFISIFSEATAPPDGTGAAGAIRKMVSLWAGEYFRRRPVARAVVLRSHVDAAMRRRVQSLNQLNFDRSIRFVSGAAKIDHADPAEALAFGFLAVRCVLRETILFREFWPGRSAPTREFLVEEVTRMVLRYLGIAERPKSTRDEEGEA